MDRGKSDLKRLGSIPPPLPISSVLNHLPNPYLGSVVVGSPSGSQANPDLGEIVIVDSAPATDSGPFLGTINEDT